MKTLAFGTLLVATAAIITLSGGVAPIPAAPEKTGEETTGTQRWISHPGIAYGADAAQVMDVYVPALGSRHLTILLIHGGGWIGGDKMHLAEIAEKLAADGFTVANINYRLATATANHYPAAVDDAESALAFLKKNAAQYKVDSARIGAFGLSAGANIALELGIAHAVQAVVDFYGPTNFADPIFLADTFDGESNSTIVATYLGGTLADKPALYKAASPLDTVTKQMPPTIVFHGELDHVVPVGQATDFYRVLTRLGVISKLEIEPTEGHGFETNSHSSPDVCLQQCARFLHASLRGNPGE